MWEIVIGIFFGFGRNNFYIWRVLDYIEVWVIYDVMSDIRERF